MKTQNPTCQSHHSSPPKGNTSPLNPIRALVAGLALAAFTVSTYAANVLSNPSMEAGLTAGWNPYGHNDGDNWNSYALATIPDPTVTGNSSFKVYASWNSDPNWNGTYQDVACLPTSVFTAMGWFRTKTGDSIVGAYGGGTTPDDGNVCWIEVTFRDDANSVLALYKSAVFDGTWGIDIWHDMSVTNECDIATGLPTNSVTTLVAPTGTTKARYQVVLKQSQWHGGGALWVDDMVLDQLSGPTAPVVNNLSPGSILLANAAAGLGFTASSQSGTTIEAAGIKVSVNGTDVSASLSVSGTATSKNVSYQGLESNKVYSVAILVTDTLGLTTSTTMSFDTWSPSFVWEAEDYDFNGGSYIDNPILSSSPQDGSYFGRTASEGVDVNETNGEGDHFYRASDRTATTLPGDIPRKKFLDAQAVDPLINDYKIGWYNGGEWQNFTRTFPAGVYNVYVRVAGGGDPCVMTLSKVTEGWGSSTQTTTNLGTFSFAGAGWSSYQYVPMKDASGNLVALTLSGTNTLRLTSTGNGDANFLMLVPADMSLPVIGGVYPSGLSLMQATNRLSFSVSSTGPAIENSAIGVVLNGVNISSSLEITGTATQKSVSYLGLLPNTPSYVAVISVTNANGVVAGTTIRFDTFNPNYYTWEAEDYDYGLGQFFDNPQTNAYVDLLPEIDIDAHEIGYNGNINYRSTDGIGTEITSDQSRVWHAGVEDYSVGWYGAGEWMNYTRHYPAGKYYVYGRFARGTGTNAAPTLSRVTSGWGTLTQTTETLGSFSVDSHGWTSFAWVPMRDTGGNQVALTLDGSTNTFRLTSTGPEANTEANVNFLMLVPVPEPVSLTVSAGNGKVVLSFPTASGFTYTLLSQGALSDANWSVLDTVAGNGAVQSVTNTISGDGRFYRLLIN